MFSENWSIAFPELGDANDVSSTKNLPINHHGMIGITSTNDDSMSSSPKEELDRCIEEIAVPVYQIDVPVYQIDIDCTKSVDAKKNRSLKPLKLKSIFMNQNEAYVCSTPREKCTYNPSTKYKVDDLQHTRPADGNNCPPNGNQLESCSQKTFSSSTSSDLLDKISLIDVDNVGIDSLLSLPSPDAPLNAFDISPITERTEKSDASFLPDYEFTSAGNQKISPSTNTNVLMTINSHKKSKIPVFSHRKPSISSSESFFSFASYYENPVKQIKPPKSFHLKRSVSSECLPNASLTSSSASSSYFATNAFSDSGIKKNNFSGRRSVSVLSLSEDKSCKLDKRRISNLKYVNSQSTGNLPNKRSRYKYSHVTSKVKKYIDGIKSSESSRRASPSRSNTSTPCNDSKMGSIFLLDENLISLDDHHDDLPKELQILVQQLKQAKDNPNLLRTLLKVLIEERKARSENEQTLAALQLEYDNLLAKHAHSQNLIDDLRLQNISEGTRDLSDCFWPPFSQSCSSTPRFRRHSLTLATDRGHSQYTSHLSASQPNLVKSTAFSISEPTMGISVDGGGSIHFLPAPFDSNQSIILGSNDNENIQPSISKSLNTNTCIQSPNCNKEEYSKQSLSYEKNSSRDSGFNKKDNGSFELLTSKESKYSSLSQKLLNFATLLASDGLNRDETNSIWRSLLAQVR